MITAIATVLAVAFFASIAAVVAASVADVAHA
jgi:hypothetical protein